MKINRLEHGNQAGSVTGTNFVVCSYGKFQPGRPRNPRKTTRMVEHKLVSSSAVIALWILAAMLRKRSQVSSTDHKNRDLGNRASSASHMNTSEFYEGKSGEASSRKPSQSG